MVFILGRDCAYSKPTIYSSQDTVKVKTQKGLSINLEELFEK